MKSEALAGRVFRIIVSIVGLLLLVGGCGTGSTPRVVTQTIGVTTPTPHEETAVPPSVTNTRRPTKTKSPTAQPTATAAPTVAAPATEHSPTTAPTAPLPTSAPTKGQPTVVPPPPTAEPTAAPPPPPGPAQVVIAGVYNSGKVEHVTISNVGSSDADMGRWSVTGSKGDERYTFPSDYVLPAGVSMRLHSGQGGVNQPPYDIYWTDKNVWNNDGETVFLWDANGNLVHQFAYK